ncbi:MAG: Rid family hydrolase [Thermomicrobiales bacterium]
MPTHRRPAPSTPETPIPEARQRPVPGSCRWQYGVSPWSGWDRIWKHAKWLVSGTRRRKTEQAMRNIAMLLEEAGAELGDIVKIVIYLTDARYRDAVYPAARSLS